MEPPKKDSEPTQENIDKLELWLSSIIAGHPGATNTYTFYEEIENYLGPWGEEGYPIGYGKKYNILFTTDPHLMTNGDVQQWVWKTTIRLQEALRDFIVVAYRDNKLNPAKYQPEEFQRDLKEAAFKSHAQAYVSGGLTVVALVSPNSLWYIGKIPRKEFSPLSPNFKASVEQVLSVIEKVIPEVAGITLATAAGPAHSGSLQYAHRKDLEAVRDQAQAISALNWLKAAIERKELDVTPTLDEIIRRLDARQYPDIRTAALARKVIESARTRKKALTHGYHREVLNDPSLRFFYDKYLQGWTRP